jgi:hypothetical protein
MAWEKLKKWLGLGEKPEGPPSTSPDGDSTDPRADLPDSPNTGPGDGTQGPPSTAPGGDSTGPGGGSLDTPTTGPG